MLIQNQVNEDMLDSPQLWMVSAEPTGAIKGSLREALQMAHKLSTEGGCLIRITRIGPDEVVIEPEQINWLWKQLGLTVSK